MNGHKELSFLETVLADLRKTPKRIQPKFQYDATGDVLFQQIMREEDYYPARAEAEILSQQTEAVATALLQDAPALDLVDLGAGDASKTLFLLEHFLQQGVDLTYYPVDISGAVIRQLQSTLPEQLPGLKLRGMHGDYLDMLQQVTRMSPNPKAVLLLGGSLGNFTVDQATVLLQDIARCLGPRDLLFIGFDLVKHPHRINAAYNTPYSTLFSLNFLARLNKDLDAEFELSRFEHYSVYDPAVRAQKNFLISKEAQTVRVGGEAVHFAQHEPIHTSMAQKYTQPETEALAASAGFRPLQHFYDSQKLFFNALWQKKE